MRTTKVAKRALALGLMSALPYTAAAHDREGCAHGNARTPRFRFSTVDLPGAAGTIAQGINNQGVIVGLAFGVDQSGWVLRKGRFKALSFGAPGTTELNGLNEAGVILGDYSGDDGKLHGFRLERGVKTDEDFPGAALTVPVGISNRGLVSGLYTEDPSFATGFHGYTYEDGVFSSFDFPGASETLLFGNNERGQILGVGFDAAGGHSFVKQGDKLREIAFPGAVYTQAVSINDCGDVVGHYQTTPGLPAAQPEHGFLLRRGRYLRIDYPGATATRLFSINDRGQIVGWWVDTAGGNHGLLATPR